MTWYDDILQPDPVSGQIKPTPSVWQAFFLYVKNLSFDDLTLSDTTINDVSTSKHGLVPKLDGNTNHFLRSDGSQAAPPGSGGVGGATGVVDGAIIVADGTGGNTLKGSDITIVTTLGADDTTVPTSNAVKNVTDGKAPLASPAFTGTVTTPAIKITGGTPGVGKVLVSDADGDGAWTTVGGGDVVGPASATDGHMAVFDGATGKLLKDGGAPGGGGASLWTALGTPTYASSSTFTLTGDQTALLYAGRALKYTISGVVYPGRVVSATYSSPNTTVTVRGWPLTNNLTAVSYGDDSRTGTVTFVIPNYYEPSATAATMLNDRVRLASGFTWSKPPSYIIGLDLQHIANDGSTAPNVNGVVNGNLLSTANTNAGPAMSSTSLISTGVDLNTTLANILISTGQKLECKITTNSAAAYQNATDLTITFIWVDIS